MIAAPTPDDLLDTVRAHAAVGAWSEVRAVLAARAAEAREHPELLTAWAEASLRTGNPRDAFDWLGSHLGVVERSGDRVQLRRALNLLGVAQAELGALEEAEHVFDRAAELGRADEDELLVARATNNLAAIAHTRGRHDVAIALYALALPAYQRLGSARGLAESYHNLAITLRERGELDRADECERRAIEYAREASLPALAAMARVGRAEICLRRDDPQLAEATAAVAARELAVAGDPIREADALRVSGVARLRRNDPEGARAALDRAVELAHEHGHMLIEAECRRARATVLLALGDRARGRSELGSALALFEKLGAAAEADEARRALNGLEA